MRLVDMGELRAGSIRRLTIAWALFAAALTCLVSLPAADAARKQKSKKTGKVPTLIYIAAEKLEISEDSDASYVTQYWAAQTNGKKRRLLFTSRGGGLKVNRNGGWTPCCKRIYLLKDEVASSRNARLIQIGVDGSREKRFARLPVPFEGGNTANSVVLSLSADNADVSERTGRVAYADDLSTGGLGIWTMERNGATRMVIKTSSGQGYDGESPNGDVAISPSGTAIAYSTDPLALGVEPRTRFYVVSHDGSNPRLVHEQLKRDQSNEYWRADVEDFSGQGARLLITQRFENQITYDDHHDVFLVNTLGFGAERLSVPTLSETDPVFDPTATRIAFSEEPVGNTDPADIFLMSSTGGNVRRFAHRRKRQLRPLMWINVRWERRKGTGR